MTRGIVIFGCALALFATTARADESANDANDDHRRHKTETNGLALGAGLGTQYGGFLGIQAMYYVQMPRSLFRLAPYLAAGIGYCAGSSEQTHCAAGHALGVQGSWGHKHRVTLSLSYATVAATALFLHGQVADANAVQGIGLAVGYEWMAFSGFIFRTDIGLAYSFWPSLLSDNSPIVPTITLVGLGYKF